MRYPPHRYIESTHGLHEDKAQTTRVKKSMSLSAERRFFYPARESIFLLFFFLSSVIQEVELIIHHQQTSPIAVGSIFVGYTHTHTHTHTRTHTDQSRRRRFLKFSSSLVWEVKRRNSVFQLIFTLIGTNSCYSTMQL